MLLFADGSKVWPQKHRDTWERSLFVFFIRVQKQVKHAWQVF